MSEDETIMLEYDTFPEARDKLVQQYATEMKEFKQKFEELAGK